MIYCCLISMVILSGCTKTENKFEGLNTPGAKESAIQYNSFFLPEKDGNVQPYVGDTMPYYEDGTYYIYYLKDGGDSYNHSVYLATTSDESRAINFNSTPKIIISASGMCEAGRIKHHLKHNLWKSENTILFVGYQALNTLGRSLVEGAKTVKLFGEEISVKAQILVLAGISGHADVDGLNEWISSVKGVKKVFVNHSEASVADEFTAHLKKDMGLESYAPYSGGVLNILTGEFTNASPIPVEKKSKGFSPGYQRLVASLERLTALVNKSSGLTNKELARMTDTLNNLCSKWEA